MRKSHSRLLANRNKEKLFSFWIRRKEHISQVATGSQLVTLKGINILTKLTHKKYLKIVWNSIWLSDVSANPQNQPTFECILPVEL